MNLLSNIQPNNSLLDFIEVLKEVFEIFNMGNYFILNEIFLNLTFCVK